MKLDYRASHSNELSARPISYQFDEKFRELGISELSRRLDRDLRDDETVYVINRLQVTTRHWGQRLSRTAELWASSSAETVCQLIANGFDDGQSFVKFSNQSTFIAAFIVDLIRGQAWEKWYFGAFRHLKDLTFTEAIRSVLRENDEYLAQVLQRLSELDSLNPVLAQLDDAALREVWCELGSVALSDPVSAEPLFQMATRIVDSLDLWKVAPANLTALFQQYAEAHRPSVDWRSRRSLTIGAVDALTFLRDAGLLRESAADSHTHRDQSLNRVVAELDWLDTSLLQREIERLLVSDRYRDAEFEAANTDDLDWIMDAAITIVTTIDFVHDVALDRDDIARMYQSSRPRRVDWASRRSRADAVVAVIRFLITERIVKIPNETMPGSLKESLVPVVRDLDWLDGDWLVEQLQGMVPINAGNARDSRWDDRDESADLKQAPDDRLVSDRERQDELDAIGADGSELIIDAAIKIVDTIGLVHDAAIDRDDIGQRYASSQPKRFDWSSRRSLADSAVEVIRWMIAERIVKIPSKTTASSVRESLLSLIRDLDWLDGDWVAEQLQVIIAAKPGSIDVDQHSAPEQRDDSIRSLLSYLRDAVVEVGSEFDRANPDSHANAIRLYTALISHDERWAERDDATEAVRVVLQAWSLLTSGCDLDDPLVSLRRGNVRSVVDSFSLPLRTRARRVLGELVRLGPAAIDVVEELLAPRMRQAKSIDSAKASGEPIAADSAAIGIETRYAGVFLLLRAVQDIGLAGIVSRAVPVAESQKELVSAISIAIGLRWAGVNFEPGGNVDSGLSLFSGFEHQASMNDFHRSLRRLSSKEVEAIQRELVVQLAGQGLFDRDHLDVGRISSHDESNLIAGCARSNVWPFGRFVTSSDFDRQLQWWQDVCRELFDQTPSIDTTEQDPRSIGDLDCLAVGTIGAAAIDLTTQLTAHALLRVWARWLGRFAGSSSGYLLENFVRRRGRIRMNGSTIHVELEPAGLDVVLKLSGYLSPLEDVASLGGRSVVFEIPES